MIAGVLLVVFIVFAFMGLMSFCSDEDNVDDVSIELVSRDHHHDEDDHECSGIYLACGDLVIPIPIPGEET